LVKERRAARILVVFVDGLGLAPEGAHNPLTTAAMPALRQLIGGSLTLERVQRREGWCLVPLDATLGVAGLPQSATGQTALFSGRNGALLLGRHVAAFPGPRLRAILEQHNLLLDARRRGLDVAFANAFAPRYFELIAARRLRHSVTVSSALAAGLSLRGTAELARGEALSWDIEGDLVEAATGVAPVSAAEAGRRLLRLSLRHRLTLYETFLTDLAAHRRVPLSVEEVLSRLDSLLGSLLPALPAELTLLLTSDHGNLEDARDGRHTRNPVPLLAVGARALRFAALQSILDLTPAILAELGGEAPE
jgi:2,3-bisphosphoglycerate-independent phosphoglycerate mutase